jgi:hypothetical protein
LIAMLLHASVNLWVGFYNPLFLGLAADMQNVWLAVAYVGMAILLHLLAGPDLGRKSTAAAGQKIPADQSVAVK